MAYVTNGSIDIYYRTEGDSSNPPLVLMHWFMGSHQTWYDIGWVRILQDHFFLIMPDHRGYGQSSKPHDPKAYQPELHVSDIEAILDDLGVDQAHFMGYSMGGRIGFALMAFAPQRVLSMVIGGMHPYSSDRIPTNLDRRVDLLNQGMEATLQAYEIGPPAVFDRMAQNDAEALLADAIQTRQWQGLQEEVSRCSQPVLLFVGKEDGFYDGMREISEQLQDCRFIAFSGEDHRTAFLKRQLVLPHLNRFYNMTLS